MIDDIERRLRRAAPRGAPPELRARVLAAVDDELRSGARRRSRPGLAVAAVVLASLGLNAWVSDRQERRMAVVLGPPPVRRQAAEIAEDVATIADPAAARWVYQRLEDGLAVPDDSRRSVAARLRQTIRQLTTDFEETADEALPYQEDPQMDRDRRGCRDRAPAGRQRDLRLAHRLTA